MNATKRSPAPYAAVGIFAAFVFAVVLIVAAVNDPSWVLGESKVTDLGVSDVGITADLFNYGCMLTGILVIVFGAGKALTEDGCGLASGIVAAFAGLMLVLVGAFTSESDAAVNEAAGLLLVLFVALAVILSVFGDWAEGRRVSAAVSAILVVVAIGAAVGNTAEYTAVVVLACLVVWLLSESAKMAAEVVGSIKVPSKAGTA